MGAVDRDILTSRTTAVHEDPVANVSTRPAAANSEAEARRRARQFAIVLMGASSVATLAILAGIWLLLWAPL